MMSLSQHGSSECSNVNNFKCCKSKQFIHYVCIKCYGIFHKCCIPKLKHKLRLINTNKVICCETVSEYTDYEDEKDNLEKTIQDITEDSELKNKYIEKIKAENKAFLLEAMKREDEMGESIKQQENLIRELKNYINNLTKTIDLKTDKQKNSAGTQTNLKTYKHVSSSTDSNISTIICETKSKIVEVDKIYTNLQDTIQGDKQNTNRSKCEIRNSLNLFKEITSTTKNKVLLLTDDNNVNLQLRRKLDLSSYEIISVKKPGALLHQVMENVESLSRNFNSQDYVIIIGGCNDIENRKTPSFRSICNKLKLCTHTNVLFASVPYFKNNELKNRHVFKYNSKLNNFLFNFNKYTECTVKYIEMNHETSKWNSRLVALNIANAMCLKKDWNKNLKFIDINNSESISILDDNNKITESDGATLSIHEDHASSSNFLYPRLHQLNLLEEI